MLVIWLFFSMILDLLILYSIDGPDIYRHIWLWGSYLVVALCVFFFHKKRHVEIRRVQKAAAKPPAAHH
jgi:hypothetical protein